MTEQPAPAAAPAPAPKLAPAPAPGNKSMTFTVPLPSAATQASTAVGTMIGFALWALHTYAPGAPGWLQAAVPIAVPALYGAVSAWLIRKNVLKKVT